MKKQQNFEALEERLRRQGQADVSLVFRPEGAAAAALAEPSKASSEQTAARPSTRKAWLPLAATLSILLTLSLLLPLIAHLGDSSSDRSSLESSLDEQSLSASVTDASSSTTLPSTPPDQPVSLTYLPTSYGASFVNLSQMILSDQPTGELTVVEAPDFRSANLFAQPGNRLISAYYAGMEFADSSHSSCKEVYYDLQKSELFCLSHTLQALLDNLSPDLPAYDELSVYSFGTRRDLCVCYLQTGEFSYEYYIANFAEQTFVRIDMPLTGPDSGTISDDYSLMAIRELDPNDQTRELCRLVDLSNGDSVQLFSDLSVFGEAEFSDDCRSLLLTRMVDGKTETDKQRKWVCYDIPGGRTTLGEGKVLYFREGVILSLTEERIVAYDCTTGEELTDCSNLPFAVEATPFHAINEPVELTWLTLYDPTESGQTVTLDNIAAYAVSKDGRWLYTYKDYDTAIVCRDLTSGEYFELPLSKEFVESAHSVEGTIRYTLTVSADRTSIAIGYDIQPFEQISEQMLYRENARQLRQFVENTFNRSENLLDFLTRFEADPMSRHSQIVYTAADCYDGYLVWEILYLHSELDNESHLEYRSEGLRIVEDYRDGTLTLYNARSNPHFIPAVSDAHLSNYNFSNNENHCRRLSQNADYDATRQKLTAIDRTIGSAFDYANCYDENGEWSNTLAQCYISSYDYLRNLTQSAVFVENDALDELIEILSRNPRTEQIKEYPCQEVCLIRLCDAYGNTVYQSYLLISASGKYYLSQTALGNLPVTEISEEDYRALMALYNDSL